MPGKNPEVSQFSIYGSGHVGIFGSIVSTTNVEGILKLDVLATDFYKDRSYPTYLVYNPYKEAKTIVYKTNGSKKVDLFDTITQKIIARGIVGKANISVPKSASVLIVEIPSASKIVKTKAKTTANGTVIAYHL